MTAPVPSAAPATADPSSGRRLRATPVAGTPTGLRAAPVLPIRRWAGTDGQVPAGPVAQALAASGLGAGTTWGRSPDGDGGRAARRAPAVHVPGLDGLRGVAVAMVVAFHLRLHQASGGFVGVDVFFVLSGYLITGLLVRGQATSGSVGLLGFWARRARRLLPALLVLLAVLAVVAAADPRLVDPGALRTNGLATLLYVQNWHLALQSHTARVAEIFAPSPLEHTWSLAMEEQFYLVWPLVVAWALRRRRGRAPRPGRLWAVVVAGTIASVSLMAALSLSGAGPLTVYYDGGAQAFELLVGAAVALVLPLGGAPVPAVGRRPRWALRHPLTAGAVAAAGAAGLVAFAVAVPGIGEAWLYRGGLLLATVAAAAVVVGVVAAPATPVSRLLAWRPLVALGRISYGVYLWHWPVLVLVTTATTGLRGLPLVLLQLGLTLAVSMASRVLVERPVLAAGARARKGATRRAAAAPATARRLVATGAPVTVPAVTARRAVVAQPEAAAP